MLLLFLLILFYPFCCSSAALLLFLCCSVASLLLCLSLSLSASCLRGRLSSWLDVFAHLIDLSPFLCFCLSLSSRSQGCVGSQTTPKRTPQRHQTSHSDTPSESCLPCSFPALDIFLFLKQNFVLTCSIRIVLAMFFSALLLVFLVLTLVLFARWHLWFGLGVCSFDVF